MYKPPFSGSRILLIALALPVLALAAHPTLAGTLGLDVWNLPNLQKSVDESRDLARELDSRDEEVRRRIVIKEALISELIAGRVDLHEVASQFLNLNEMFPEYMAVIRLTYRGSTDMEKTIQNVIDFATVRMPNGASRDELRARLEVERDEMLNLPAAH